MSIRIALFLATVILGRPVFGLELQSLRFTPTSLHVGGTEAAVTIQFTVAGGASEVTYFEASFVDSAGVCRVSGSVKPTPSLTVTDSVRIGWPQFAGPGIWTLSTVFARNAIGETLLLDAAELNRRGFETRLDVESPKDTTSPKLNALEITPVRIDTSDGPTEINVAYTASDDLSGLNAIELGFQSPTRTITLRGSAKLEGSRQASRSIQITVPRLTEPGEWVLAFLLLSDVAGNTLYLDREGMQGFGFRTTFDVTSRADAVSPKLTALSVTPAEIDTSRGPGVVRVEYSATDDLSGVASIETVFVNPSGTAWQRASAVISAATAASGSVDVKFPEAAEAGRWRLCAVLLADAVGNTAVLDDDRLAELGFRSVVNVKSSNGPF
jgi:hypothetical protein